MNPILLTSLPSMLLAAAGMSAPVASGVELQPVLEKAAARLGTPEAPAFVQTETEEDIDRHGKIYATRMTKSKQRILPDGTQHGEVLEALEDGRDVTGPVRKLRADREKKSQGKRGPPIDIDLEFKLPFEGSQQGRYHFSVVGGTALTPRVHFEPSGDRHRLWVGDATVDAATGTILSLFGHPAILPTFVDQIDVRMEFKPEVVAGTLPQRLIVEGEGHFLFFHKRMRYTSVAQVPVTPHAVPAALEVPAQATAQVVPQAGNGG
jgi:hypothetical protein